MDNFTIRRVEAGDALLFDHVADGVFDDPIRPKLLQRYLAHPGNLMVLACSGNVVVGRVAAVIHRHANKPADLYIDELNVAPTHRRRGLADRLIAEVTVWAADLGCVDCWLAAEAGNTTAQALYARLGQAKPCVLYHWPFEGA